MLLIDLPKLGLSLGVLVWLIGASHLGLRIRRSLPRLHRNTETLTALSAVILMQVTFSSIVLGLLITNAKSDFDALNGTLQRYGVNLIELDKELREMGPEGAEARQVLTVYVQTTVSGPWGAVLSSEDEIEGYLSSDPLSRPFLTSVGSLRQGERLDHIRHLLTAQSELKMDQDIARDHALELLKEISHSRYMLIERSNADLDFAFYAVLILWFTTIFMTLGLASPYNNLIRFTVTLTAITVCTAFFIVIEMRSPFNGLLQVSKDPFTNALIHISR